MESLCLRACSASRYQHCSLSYILLFIFYSSNRAHTSQSFTSTGCIKCENPHITTYKNKCDHFCSSGVWSAYTLKAALHSLTTLIQSPFITNQSPDSLTTNLLHVARSNLIKLGFRVNKHGGQRAETIAMRLLHLSLHQKNKETIKSKRHPEHGLYMLSRHIIFTV